MGSEITNWLCNNHWLTKDLLIKMNQNKNNNKIKCVLTKHFETNRCNHHKLCYSLKNVFLLSVVWITNIYLIWNLVVSQELGNLNCMEAMNTLQPVSTSMMSREDESPHTAVPSYEVWKISYYNYHYHYCAQICSSFR